MDRKPIAPLDTFPDTSWTLLVEARTEEQAREQFARRYRPAVLDYFTALARDRDDAERLTQDFFAQLAKSGQVIANADQSRGAFRPYLKRALANFWKSDIRHASRRKRHVAQPLHPDGWPKGGWDTLGLRSEESPEAAFHNGWVRGLLNEALDRVQTICERKQQTQHYRLFVGMYLCDASSPPTWRQLAAAFALDEKAAQSKAATVARHLRLVLRQMLREDLQTTDSVDEELAALLTWL